MDSLTNFTDFFYNHDKGLSVLSSLIIAGSSITTFILALVVFVVSRKHEKRTKQLIEEIKVALIMIASIRGGADAGKRIYDEYKKEILDSPKKK